MARQDKRPPCGPTRGTASAAQRSDKVSIILPTYNERDTIVDVVDGVVAALGDRVEIIVVDDDSPDGTWSAVEKLAHPQVIVIRRIATRGLASAVNRGIIESRGSVVGWMDADLGMPPGLLSQMVELTSQFDIVIGSRYARGGGDDRRKLRVLASRCINALARLVLGFGIRDYDSGFVVLRRSVFDQVTLRPFGNGSYFIDFLYACLKKGLSVYECPYTFSDRTRGESKSAPTLWQFLVAGVGYVVTIIAARLRRIE